MSGSGTPRLTVFGVSLEELMLRVPPSQDALKGVLAAEQYLLAVERLNTDPGESRPALVILTAGVLGMAAAGEQADGLR